jgi:DNA-directed RNA polymerase specialized sigma24 family protein
MTAVTRPSEAVITELPEFSLLWPSLFSRVVGNLRQRGVDWASAEDAAQEAGARALAHGVPYTSEDDLCRWVQTVAWRVAVDNHRRTARWSGAGGPTSVAATDVAHEVEARLQLCNVGRVFSRLSASDQAALLEVTPPDQTRQEAVRAAVRRHRARARLVALVEGLGGVVALPSWRRLRLWRALVVPTVAAAVLVPFALLLPGAPHDPPSGSQEQGSRVATRSLLVPAALVVDAGATHGLGGSAGSGDGHAPARAPAAGGGGGAASGAITLQAGIPGTPGEPPQGAVGVRPKHPDEPVFCSSNTTTGRTCTPENAVIAVVSSASPVPLPRP